MTNNPIIDNLDFDNINSEDFNLTTTPVINVDKFELPKKAKVEDCKSLQDVVLNTDRTVVFIEGSHLFNASRDMGLNIEFHDLRLLFLYSCNLLRICYYNNVKDDSYNPIVPLAKYLSFNGYETYIDVEDAESRNKELTATNTRVRIIADILHYAYSGKIDHIVLFAGSSTYAYPISLTKRLGIKVTTISTRFILDEGYKVSRSKISNELRSATDNYIDLMDLYPYIIK